MTFHFFFDTSINTRIVLNGFNTDFKCIFSYQEECPQVYGKEVSLKWVD